MIVRQRWCIVLLCLSSSALAAESPIDKTLQECLNQSTSTVALSQCYDTASQAWDKEMNNQYQALMKKLAGEDKTRFRDAQRTWLKYRESWMAANGSYFHHSQGTMAALSIGAQKVDLIKNQALMLRSLNQDSCTNPGDCG